MRLKQLILPLLLLVGFLTPALVEAHVDPERDARPANASENQQINFRSNCDNAVAQIDMQINNVRARLTTGGDVWWDGDNGRYVVPKPPPGIPEVSSIFAGAVWLGGRDPGGGLKVAAQDYGRSGGSFDYYPGPLTDDGTVTQDTCARWDKFFKVSGQSIRDIRTAYQVALETNTLPLDISDIPTDVLGWPSSGNPYFWDVNRFELPTTTQGLAGFWDEDLDGIYDPTLGDYPIIEIRGCGETPQFPEEMVFWIYNDAGNTHRQSNTPLQIQMEIQVQAFAYTTSDDINNMTFQRYKLINRAQEDILDTYFAMWVDPDLGCFTDDYVGCDTTRSMAYVYNEDELDGENGCTCSGGVNTYCDEIPILGVDYFRGPRAPIFCEDDEGNPFPCGEEELGMSSFIYINNRGVGTPPPPTTDPSTSEEYYNYLQGIWRDGTPLFDEGNGYDQNGAGTTRFAFADAPNDPAGWSMVTADLPFGDRRTLQASGPFTLQPGAVNELIIGVVWVPDQTYPAPSIQRLQQADDLAQSLFDNCFDICDGPDAPNVDVVELDREVVLLLSNPRSSNNFNEEYTEPGLGVPPGFDSLYRFEGYRVFQLAGPDVSLADIEDPERVREIAQFDLDNGITKVFNWRPVGESDNPLPEPFLAPELVSSGSDNGLRHSLRITEDAFASGGETRLINHRRYYFTVVAYGYNNYKEYDPLDNDNPGQSQQYKASSRNIGDQLTGNPYYLVIPRPILDQTLAAEYGDGAQVTRISGRGNNGNFLDIVAEDRAEMEDAFAAGDITYPEITYQTGAGPIDVNVVDPRNVVDGDFEITFFDEDMTNDELDAPVNWMLRCLDDCGEPTILSERPISVDNEQIIPEFGFAVSLANAAEPGREPQKGNGAIGGTITYADPSVDPWLGFLPDDFDPGLANATALNANLFNYVTTGDMGETQDKDPERDFDDLLPGFYPMSLMGFRERENGIPYLTPMWLSPSGAAAATGRQLTLDRVNNVDIVMTSNKELWSRCPVIETSSYFTDGAVLDGEVIKPDDYPIMFDVRDAPSVSKDGDGDGGAAVDSEIDPGLSTGMGWFPGYAVDVETGERLAIFFGENSLYDGRTIGEEDVTLGATGADMIWNPSSTILNPIGRGGPNSLLLNFEAGAQHYIYVTSRPYDAGEYLHGRFSRNLTRKRDGVGSVTWAGFPVLMPEAELLSYEEGLIPNDVTIKLRVTSEYDYAEGTDDSNGYPTYRFSVDGKASEKQLDDVGISRALNMINVVPNPYYAFSTYEDSQFETNVKITNLPAQATVTIYSLDGKFIRKYERDEAPTMLRGEGRPVGSRQISPALEWDLKNFRGIPIASGVYLIHVAAPGLGERTLKFFGVQRQFDPSGL